MKQDYSHLSWEFLCRLFGKTRHAYYDHLWRSQKATLKEEIILQLVDEIRASLPRLGTRKMLHLLAPGLASHDIDVGRDYLFGLLDAYQLLIRRRRKKVFTTDSRHWMHKYPNLVKGLDIRRPEQKQEQLSLIFTALAIFIACLGLFGLAAFTTQQRVKEIGIRKVLGASIAGVVTLLSRDFIKLVLIAIVIAVPVAFYAMEKWLQGFAYRITMEWWMFALAGLLAVVIALLTVSFQSVKAALMNPVKSLRSE